MKSSPNRYFVYAFLDPREKGDYEFGNHKFKYEPFYVGKGSGARNYEHLRVAKNTKKNYFVTNKIRSIMRNGHLPIFHKILTGLNESDAYRYEMSIIKTIGRIKDGGVLVNATDGGEGLRSPSSDVKKKMSEKAKSNWINVDRVERSRILKIGHSEINMERKDDIAKASSVRMKKYWATMPNSKREERHKKSSESAIKMWTNRSEKVRESICSKTKHRMNLPENRNRLAFYFSKLTPEQELRRRAKLSERAKGQWSRMTDQEKLNLSKKRSESQRRRRLLENCNAPMSVVYNLNQGDST